MSATYDDFKILNDQVLIYRRMDSGDTWHCRIKFPSKPYVRKSLKTTSRKKAKELASEILAGLKYKNDKGLSINSRKFRHVAALYIKYLEENVERGSIKPKRLKHYSQIIERYFIPYYGKKDIDKISDSVLDDYRHWRDVYWLTGDGSKRQYVEYTRNGKTIRSPMRKPKQPSKSTLNTEDTVLRQVFEYARKRGFLASEEIPLIKSAPVKTNRRPDFSLKDYTSLIRKSVWRYKKAPDERIRNQRQLLHDYILVMANSGMRPIEAATLRWQDIVEFTAKDDKGEEQTFIKMSVRGKSKQRDFVPMPRVRHYLERIHDRQKVFADKHGYEVKKTDFIFVDEYGEPIKSFKNGFNQLLEHSGITLNNHGQKRVIYSLRHSYATFRLIYGGVSVYELAQNMGTSVEMIEKHYGHLKPEQVAGRLTRFI